MSDTLYNKDGTLKKHFYRGAAGGLRTMHKNLMTWHDRYATLMHLESTCAGLLDEIDIMQRVVEELEREQAEKVARERAEDKALLDKGFPKKQTPFERMYKKNKQNPEG